MDITTKVTEIKYSFDEDDSFDIYVNGIKHESSYDKTKHVYNVHGKK